MLWLTIGVVVGIAALAIAYVTAPLWRPRRPLVEADDTPLAALIERKDATLRAIKELEFDYQMGKLSEEDFERDNVRLRHQAIALMKRIEELAPESEELDARLESLIAQHRQVSDPVAGNGVDAGVDEVETETETVREPSAEAKAEKIFCPACGAPADPDDNFCAVCGAPLRKAAPA
jgi:hypothetical protein